jgi:hypothetical protein
MPKSELGFYYTKVIILNDLMSQVMDYGHPERAFFQKSHTFGLGKTNWAEKFWGIWGIFSQFISTHFGTVGSFF